MCSYNGRYRSVPLWNSVNYTMCPVRGITSGWDEMVSLTAMKSAKTVGWVRKRYPYSLPVDGIPPNSRHSSDTNRMEGMRFVGMEVHAKTADSWLSSQKPISIPPRNWTRCASQSIKPGVSCLKTFTEGCLGYHIHQIRRKVVLSRLLFGLVQ